MGDLLPSVEPLSWEERREENLFRVGRYATFDRRALSHIARQEVEKFLLEEK
jgi:hypothetical protein